MDPTPVKILAPQVSERIAAGEVIERPANIIKELVENSLDAGARQIKVILEDGGKSKLEVVDDGHGMTPSDLKLCTLRHATSKLTTLEDLERLRSLGFRGEALPSIAAVAYLKIISSHHPDSGPSEIWIDETQALQGPQSSSPRMFLGDATGTHVQVESLFAQIPARLKFLRSPRSETLQIKEWLEKLSLSRPEIGFELETGSKKPALQIVPQDTPLDSHQLRLIRIRELLADGNDFPIVRHREEFPLPLGGHLDLYWVSGLSAGNSKKMAQIVNGRVTKDRLIGQALMSGFKQHLLPGQYPALAAYLEIDPSVVDINVHPTKTEVRFADNNALYKTIYRAVETIIHKHGVGAYVGGRATEEVSLPLSSSAGMSFRHGSSKRPSQERPIQNSFLLQSQKTPPTEDQRFTQTTAPLPSSTPISKEASLFDLLSQAKFQGILFHTYVMLEYLDEVILVDQHAAHERVRFEKLVQRLDQSQDSQSLLVPEAIQIKVMLTESQKEKVTIDLARVGFESEWFGEQTLLFRAVPSLWGSSQLPVRLKNLVERLIADTNQALDETLFEAMASEACHSAIRAGDPLEPVEAQALVKQLIDCQNPWNCPHGRPTTVRLKRARFEEWFQRRV